MQHCYIRKCRNQRKQMKIIWILDKSRTTIQDTLNELAAVGLMERKRTRFAAANHIYVKVPPVVQISVPMTAGKLDL